MCESSTWPAQCVLFAEHTAQVTDRQSTCARVGNPSECEVCFWDVQSDVMAARVVGIRQEGESLPGGAVQEGRGTRAAAMASWAGARRATVNWCASCELPRWCCANSKKGLRDPPDRGPYHSKHR